jgi:pyruvate carboxylase
MGIDLVKMQLLLAQGLSLPELGISHLSESPEIPAPIYSLQLRVTAEDASKDWTLSVGKINLIRFPVGNGIRVDSHILPSKATVIGTDFDSLIAKIIITAPTWGDVVRKAKRALADTHIEGVKTSLDVLRGIVDSDAFAVQGCDTQWLEANLQSVVESGKRISSQLTNTSTATLTTPSTSAPVSPNVLFRKGDAWSISLTPEASQSETTLTPAPSHLQLTRIHRNEFPTSLTASILYTTPTQQTPIPYTLTLASTTASFGSLSNATTHRRGNPGNQNHVITPFAGKLMEILVDVGDEVKKGETVAVVRQMKMELEIRASKGGRLGWVYEGEEGDEIGEGVLLAEIERGGAKL